MFNDILFESTNPFDLLEKMSEEDRHDSDILRSIIDKTSIRTNAALTQEEKDVLKKYGLDRFDRGVIANGAARYLANWDADISNPEGGNKLDRGHRYRYSNGEWSYSRRSTHHNPDEINYADIARKRPARAQAYIDRINNDRITQYQDAQRDLHHAKWSRDYHQGYVDEADAKYISALQKAKQAYDDAVASATKARDTVDTYHVPQRDAAQKSMERIYDRFKR